MVEVPADLVDSASQTPLSRAGSQQTFGRSSPPAPRSRSPPGRPLPRRRATVSAARGEARLAPAARAPPCPPRRGRDHPAQTAGAAAPGSVRCPAHRRTGPTLIGQTARPPRRRPIRARDSRPAPEGAGPRRASGSRGAFPPAAGPSLRCPRRPEAV